MKKLSLVIAFLCITITSLTGCQPTVFGVPQSTWNTLTPQQKQQVIDGYNQRKAIKNAIDSAGTILTSPAVMRNQD
jgi:hypothetical protein